MHRGGGAALRDTDGSSGSGMRAKCTLDSKLYVIALAFAGARHGWTF